MKTAVVNVEVVIVVYIDVIHFRMSGRAIRLVLYSHLRLPQWSDL